MAGWSVVGRVELFARHIRLCHWCIIQSERYILPFFPARVLEQQCLSKIYKNIMSIGEKNIELLCYHLEMKVILGDLSVYSTNLQISDKV